VDVAAALRRQVRNDPGKSNLAVLFFFLFLFCAFLGDENVASSSPSPQSRLVAGDENVASTLASPESPPSDDFNYPRELDTLELSAVAKAADFPLQARNDLAKIWTKAEIIVVNDIDPIRNPQRFR
jgi:hypothetical protein